jgi:GTP-binding protein
MKFLDQAKIYLKSGDGGAGCISFRRVKYVEFGGPDGGDGGRGGDIVLECVANLNTLIDYRFQQHIKARNGRPGEGSQRTGASADDVVVPLPPGTQVLAEDGITLLADLTDPGQRIVLLKGGDGGRGNMRFKSSTNQAPRRADPGWPGEERWVWLRLKLIADVGLVGLPNAGKSTLLSRVSRAKPKIADYPFTTLHPNLGVVGVDDSEFVMADLPGLIEGAHEGVGLGDRFLGHAERCAALLHLVDGTVEDIAGDYRTIYHELEAYGGGLTAKSVVLVLNKVDAMTDEMKAEGMATLAEVSGLPVVAMSSSSGEGVEEVKRQLMHHVRLERERRAEEERES